MQTILGLPDSTLTAADPEGDLIIGEVSVNLGADDAEPEREED